MQSSTGTSTVDQRSLYLERGLVLGTKRSTQDRLAMLRAKVEEGKSKRMAALRAEARNPCIEMMDAERDMTFADPPLVSNEEFNRAFASAMELAIRSHRKANPDKVYAPRPRYGWRPRPKFGWHGQPFEDSGCKFPVGTRVRLVGTPDWVGTVLPATFPENMVFGHVCALVKFDRRENPDFYGEYRLEEVPNGNSATP